MKEQKKLYYHDLLNDDFAGTKITKHPLPKKFKFANLNPLWCFFSYLLYYIIVIPLFWLISKVFFGLKVVGRKKVKKVGLKGCFIYGNHTSFGDAWFTQSTITPPKRTYVLAGQDAVSMRPIRWLVMMLGAIPVPETFDESKRFLAAIETRYKRGDAIVIFPEAHIWPFYTRIRPFGDASFTYPATLMAPVFGICTTYSRRKVFKNLRPKTVIHVSDPFYPDPNLSLGERTSDLRRKVYDFMVECSASNENYEYIKYVHLEDGEAPEGK